MAITLESLFEQAEQTLQGNAHLFCALIDALEKRGVVTRQDVKDVIREKIRWLEKCRADIGVAAPLLLVEEWVTSPPPDPRDPYEDRPRAQVIRFPGRR